MDYFSIILRLVLCVILGGVVGFERERSNQPAGLRTHIILCVGSGLIMMISIYMSKEYTMNGVTTDPSRIAAQVVSGIGFLGAGAILRLGVSIKGLTTAASLWTIGGIGLAIGSGFYFAAIVSVAIIFISLTYLSNFQKIFLESKYEKRLLITSEDVKGIVAKVDHIVERYNTKLKNIQIERSSVKGIVEINAILSVPSGFKESSFINALTLLSEITEVELT